MLWIYVYHQGSLNGGKMSAWLKQVQERLELEDECNYWPSHESFFFLLREMLGQSREMKTECICG